MEIEKMEKWTIIEDGEVFEQVIVTYTDGSVKEIINKKSF